MTITLLVQRFLDRPRKASTQKLYKFYLDLFLERKHSFQVTDLKVFHLTELMDKRSDRHGLCKVVKTCFKWLNDNEYIDRDPFAKVKTPPCPKRGESAYIPPERWSQIVDKVHDDLLDILTVLKETGCRPQEARIIEARHLQGQCCVLTLDESKGGQTQRVIHLSDAAYAILQRLRLKYPEGPLLRARGKPWKAQQLANRCNRLGFQCYQLRHTWATNAILRGLDLQTIAVLMGHSDLTMLSKIYSHIQKRDSHLQEALQRVTA